ncbi:MAG: class I SAM-dependent methyltransferase [Candidatus Bathyarchaeota archaeon]|nr:class I SAM-dependent methyltransferase [Candidatus Bathyarchaeota archaeon]
MSTETKKYFHEGHFGIWVPTTYLSKQAKFEKMILEQFNWQNSIVLDIGVGAGRFSIAIAQKGAEVVAIDIFPKTVKLVKNIVTKHHLNNISLLIADAENLPFKAETFDITICIETLMHLAEPQTALQEIWRTTKKRKIAVVQANNKFSIHNFKGVLRETELKTYRFLIRKPLPKITPHYWLYSISSFKKMLSKVGFTFLRHDSYNPFRFKVLFIVQK